MSVIGNLITRTYSDFRGIDLLNAPNNVNLSRSPDCLNVWKSYDTTNSNIIQTRPGIKKILKITDSNDSNKINGMYMYESDKVLIHSGYKLIQWIGFPNEETTIKTLASDMLNQKSTFLNFQNNIYILDGKTYRKFDGENLVSGRTDAYIPTTTIGRSPSGGGEIYEDVNLLTYRRKNSFISDGKSLDYYLDTTNIDTIIGVYVNGKLVSNYTTDLVQGKISFTSAPSEPSLLGQDNVIVDFSKVIEEYPARIDKCSIATVFDNRIFFSGNPDYPNAIFHSSLYNPAYISDLDYYECGNSTNKIKKLVVGNNTLWVLKEENQERDAIFYMTPSIDSEYGKIYPVSQGNLAVGCFSDGINYKDTIVFLSRNGLEGINGNINYEQSIVHKSSLIDSKLINMSNYNMCIMEEYNGYLLLAIDKNIFLADYRQNFKGNTGTEYEWYLWEFPIDISCIKKCNNKLYLGDLEGNIYFLDGFNDDGQSINSYWTTPLDTFSYMNHLKTINKRGAIAKIKNMQNGRIKIAEKTNKNENYTLIKEVSGTGFSFNNFDFSNLNFSSLDNSYIVFRIKEKKIIDISIKVYSDELNKPFGLISLSLEAFIGGYVKRS